MEVWSSPHPSRCTLRERDPMPIVQEAGWAPGLVWMVAENFAPTRVSEFDPQTVQSVANCYTDYFIPAHTCNKHALNLKGTQNWKTI